MCGIAGIVTLGDQAPASATTIERMCRTIEHRGPDAEGIDVSGPVALGMRRLSIIDLEGGRQPLFNEDRTVRVVFNGEIYNYRELRRDLCARGHRFASATDGEVIVHLWEEYGPECLEHLNGMFAIALHDSRSNRILLARDRIGIKPLYYAVTATHLVFGSELKTVLAAGVVDRTIDLDAVSQFLAWEYVPAPRTLLRSIRKLDAAELMEVDLRTSRIDIRRWWDLPNGDPGSSRRTRAEDWRELVDTKLRECVRRQLVSDVPLGAFLSGGVDSSLVVAAMGEAETFSIGFDDPSYNELEWSKRVARHLGVRHTVETIRPDVIALFDRLMHFMDDPIGDFSIFPTYLVSRLAREHVTVALSGDGGDELFGGYENYVAQEMMRLWMRVPRPIRERVLVPTIASLSPRSAKKGLINKARRFVEGTAHAEALAHTRWRLFVSEALQAELFTSDAQNEMQSSSAEHILRLFEQAGDRDSIDRCLYVDLRSYLNDNCLVKTDRMSMACSLEVRVPFLDHELVELAFQVPPELKVNKGRTKILLKRAAEAHLPHECVHRPKQGFSIPIKNWLKTDFRPLMHDLLHRDRLRDAGIFEDSCVERLKHEHLTGQENHSHVLWSLMVFEDWRDRWLQ